MKSGFQGHVGTKEKDNEIKKERQNLPPTIWNKLFYNKVPKLIKPSDIALQNVKTGNLT